MELQRPASSSKGHKKKKKAKKALVAISNAKGEENYLSDYANATEKESEKEKDAEGGERERRIVEEEKKKGAEEKEEGSKEEEEEEKKAVEERGEEDMIEGGRVEGERVEEEGNGEVFKEYTIPVEQLQFDQVYPSAPAIVFPRGEEERERMAEEERGHEIEQLYPSAPMLMEEGEEGEEERGGMVGEALQLEPITDEEISLYYCNPELEGALEEIDTFKDFCLQPRNEFFELLEHYRHCRMAVASIEQEIKSIKLQCKDAATQVWSTLKRDKIGEGRCRDGVSVRHRVEFEVAVYSVDRAEELAGSLERLRCKFHNDLTRAAFECELAKLDINLYLDEFFDESDFLCLVNEKKHMDNIADVGFCEESMTKLKLAIDSLFYFERFVCKDKVFKSEIREWLDYAVSVLLQVATYSDHRYILNHAVHTRGIGEWGAKYIQFPRHITDNVVDHFVAMLYVLLKPNEFVTDKDEEGVSGAGVNREEEEMGEEEVVSMIDEDDDDWIIVGEVEPKEQVSNNLVLSEDDYISLFEQFPFGRIFSHVLKDENFFHHSRLQVMKLIALAQFLNTVLSSVFEAVSHPHFLKRVARTVVQITNYVAQHWSLLCSSSIQNEENDNGPSFSLVGHAIDHLFLRSCEWFLSAKGLGIWQFLSYFPFEHVSPEMSWKLLLLLFVHDKNINLDPTMATVRSFKVWNSFISAESSHRSNFVNLLLSLSDSETVFLLTTFANIAVKKPDLCPVIILELFHVTYLDERSRLSALCTKTGRDLLGSITVAHAEKMSFILFLVSEHIKDLGKTSLHLFRGLPINMWVPTKEDLETLRDWLLNTDFESSEHELARHIFSNINWGTKDRIDVYHNLFLSPEIHTQAAHIITEAITCHIGDESLSFLSQINTFGQLTPQRLFLNWCWSVLLSLHVHDLGHATSSNNDSSNSVDFVLKHASKHPTAAYLALQMSPYGYDFNRFKDVGLNYLKLLVDTYCYTAALRILCDVIPRFVMDPECNSLIKDSRFTYIIKCLLDADETYPTVVMHGVLRRLSLMTSREEDNITEMLISIIQDQLHFIPRADEVWPSWQQIVEFWMETICQVQGWHLLQSGRVVYDNLLQASFISPAGRIVAFRTLSAHHLLNITKNSEGSNGTEGGSSGNTNEDGNFLSTVMSWISTPRIPPPPSFLDGHPGLAIHAFVQSGKVPMMGGTKQCPWLAFEVLFMETKQENPVRLEVGRCLVRKPTLPIENISKELKLNMPVDHFCIYRWAYFGCTIDMNHPLLPLFWQMFFTLFFAEVYDEVYDARNGNTVKGFRFGDRFLGQGQALMKTKISKCLTQLSRHHRVLARKRSSVLIAGGIENESPEQRRRLSKKGLAASLMMDSGANDEIVSEHHKTLSDLYRAMNLWLFDKSVGSIHTRMHSLPADYCIPRIKTVVECDPLESSSGVLWEDLVDTDDIRTRFQTYVKRWNGRFAKWDNNVLKEEPTIDIFRELGLDGQCVPAPVFRRRAPSARELNIDNCSCDEDLIRIVQTEIDKQVLAAKQYVDNMAFHTALDADYVESLPGMYTNENRETAIDVPCNQRKTGRVCKGPARFVFQYKQKRVVTPIVDKISEDRKRLTDFLAKPCMKPELCLSVQRLQRTVRFMAAKVASMGETDGAHLRQYAKTLFYYLINVIDENMRQYPPTQSFLTRTVDSLGKNFICKETEEAPKLLDVIVGDPRRGMVLSTVFYPSTSSSEFVKLYSKVCGAMNIIGNELAVRLLGRFDVGKWVAYNPPLDERKKFLRIVIGSIKEYGQVIPPHLEEYEKCIRGIHYDTLMLHYPSLFEDGLDELVSGIVERSIPVEWVSDYCSIVVANSSSSDSNLLLLRLESLLTARLMYVRVNSGPLYPLFIPYLSEILKLYECIVQALADDMVKGNLDSLWLNAYHAFEPWLCIVPPASNSLQNILSDPWKDDPQEQSAAGMFGMTYVECISSFITAGFDAKEAIMRLWDWYFTTLSHSPVHVLRTYHDFLTSLPWENINCDNDTLIQMIQIQKGCDGESLKFLSHILTRVDWQTTERAAVGRVYNVPTTQYYQNLLQILVLCIAEAGVVGNSHFLSFLAQKAHRFQWVCLDHISYEDVLRLEVCKGKAVFLFNESASLCQYSKLLRAAVGFPEKLIENVNRSNGGLSEGNVELFNRAARKLHYYLTYVIGIISKSVDLDSNSYIFAVKFLLAHVLDDIGVRCILSLTSDSSLFNDILSASLCDILLLLNNCEAGDTEKQQIVNAFRDFINSSANRHLLISPMMECACNTLASVAHMADIVEECLETFLSDCKELNSRNQYGWAHVYNLLIPPELTYNEFIAECLNKCDALTLFCVVLQRESVSVEGPGRVNCALVQDMAEWIQRLNFTVGSSNGTNSGQGSNTNLSSADGDAFLVTKVDATRCIERKVLLLWGKYAILLAGYIRQNAGGDNEAAWRNNMAIPFLETLRRYSEDKMSKGFLGAIGLGARSKHSVRFRLFCRVLYTFLEGQLPPNGVARVDPKVVPLVRTNQCYSSAMEELRTIASAASAGGEYEGVQGVVELFLQYCDDEGKGLCDVDDLIQRLVKELFGQENVLHILKRDC
eukprot:Nk52_evm7s2449 gene=Nk52_evmTU7s2449